MAFESAETDPGSGGIVLAVSTFVDTDTVSRTLPFSGLAFGAVDAIPTPVTSSAGLPVAQQGTWTVQPGNTANTTAWLVTGTNGTFPVTDSGGSLTVDAPVGTPVFVRLSDGTNPISTLAVSLASVPSHAVTNAGTFAVQVDGAALTALQLIDDPVFADDAAFTLAASKVMMAGVIRDDALSTLSAAEGDAVPLRADANGALWVGISGAVTVGSHAVTNAGTFAVQVDGTALTRLTDIETNTDSGAVVGNGAAATAQRVTLANDSTGIVALTTSTASIGKLAANTGVDIGDVDVTSIIPGTGATNLGKAIDTATGATDTGVLTLATRDDALSSLTPAEGDNVQLRVDANGALWVVMSGTVTVASHAVTNAGTFAVQVDGNALTALQLIDDVIFTDDGAFSPGTSKVAVIGLQADETGTDSVDEGDAGCPRMTLDRKQIVTPQPHTAGGLSAAAFLSDGSTKAGVVKASAGQLYGISTGNVNAAACYVRLYNMTSNPGTGDTPVYRFMIPGNTAGSGREKNWPLGLAFSTGIAYRITTGAADNNDTATASAEVTANWDYK